MRWKRHKYGSRRVCADGFSFDSQMEADHYQELKLLQKAGEIGRIEVHPSFPIVINDIHVCTVILDFAYDQPGAGKIYEDVKGKDTALSRLKRKMVEAAIGIKVALVTKGKRIPGRGPELAQKVLGVKKDAKALPSDNPQGDSVQQNNPADSKAV